MIRIILTDDHVVVRDGLKQLFACAPDLLLVGEADSGEHLLALLRGGLHGDMLLLDLTLPGVNGTEFITQLRQLHPQLPILVLSMHNEPGIARRAMQAGATGYVTKDSEPETLLAAIRAVAAGAPFVDPSLADADAVAGPARRAGGLP